MAEASKEIAELTRLQGENARLREQLTWRAGSASELSSLLKRINDWTHIDHSREGDGPAGGYRERAEATARALDLWLSAEAALSALRSAVKPVVEEMRGYERSGADARLALQRWLSTLAVIVTQEEEEKKQKGI